MCLWFDSGTGHLVCKDRRDRRDRQDRQDREVKAQKETRKQKGHGILAQLVEHLTFNQVVGGSNPPCLIKIEFIVICYGLFLVYRKMLVALRKANENCEAILGGQNAGFALIYALRKYRSLF